jgi:hypothetical protein
MPIIACPHCGTRLNAPDSVLGKEVVCGKCQRKFVASTAGAGAAAPRDAVPRPPAGQAPPAPAPPAGAKPPAAPAAGPTPPSQPAPTAAPAPPGPKRLPLPPGPRPVGPAPGPVAPGAPPPPPAGMPRVGLPTPPPPPAGVYGPPRKSSGVAVASMILGIVSIVFCWCYGIVSVICGILALVFYNNAMRDIEAGRSPVSSAGMAKAGRICGIIGLLLGIGFWVVVIIGLAADAM